MSFLTAASSPSAFSSLKEYCLWRPWISSAVSRSAASGSSAGRSHCWYVEEAVKELSTYLHYGFVHFQTNQTNLFIIFPPLCALEVWVTTLSSCLISHSQCYLINDTTMTNSSSTRTASVHKHPSIFLANQFKPAIFLEELAQKRNKYFKS